MTLGEKIRARRKELSLTQQQLAGDDFTSAFVSQLERNILRPSLKTLSIIAARLNMPVSALLGEQAADAEIRMTRARYLFNAGRLDEAEKLIKEIMNEEAPRERLVLLAKVLEARILLTREDPKAFEVCTEFLSKLPEAHRDMVSEVEIQRGGALWQKGERVAAINSWEVALAGLEGHVNPRLRVSLLHNLATAYVQIGQTAKGDSLYAELSKEVDRSGDLEGLSGMYYDLSNQSEIDGNASDAAKFATYAEAISDAKRYLLVMAAGVHNLGSHCARRGDFSEALRNFERGVKMAKVVGDAPGTAVALTNTAACLLVLGQNEAALGNCHEAANLLPKVDSLWPKAQTHFVLACAFKAMGANEPAASHFRKAIDLSGQPTGGLQGESILAESLYSLSAVTTDKDEASDSAAKAQVLFRKLRRIPAENPAEALFM